MKKMFEKKLLFLKPNEIVCPISFARKYYDDYDIKNLADNIAVNGVIEPLIIRKNELGNFELIAGLRRLKASKMLGLRRIPCILQVADDETAAFISISENTKRTNLNMFEEAEAIKEVITRYETKEGEAADRLGIAYSNLQSKLNLLKLDSLSKKRILLAGLNQRFARLALYVPEEKRQQFLNAVIKDCLSLGGAKELARQLVADEEDIIKHSEQSPPVRKALIGDERLFANSLSKLILTMQVSGIEAYSRKTENEKYIEYRIRIPKPQTENYRQLKLV